MDIDSLSYSQWQILWMILSGFLGLCIGSFLNVLAWRIPNKVSIVKPGSHCPKCKKELSVLENIPVLSYLFLRGKCKNCSEKISIRYPIIELLTCAVWVTTTWRLGLHVYTIGYLLFFSGLIALSAIDIDTKLLPKKLVYPTGAFLVLFLGVSALITGDLNRVRDAIIVGFIYWLFLFVVWFASGGRAMGMGDVRLVIFLGFGLGYFGFIVAYIGMLLSFAIGSIFGIAIALVTRSGRKMKIPFGPFLAAGTILAIWLVPQIRELIQVTNV